MNNTTPDPLPKPAAPTDLDAELDRIMTMPEAQLDAEIRAEGGDPDDYAKRGHAAIEKAFERAGVPIKPAAPIRGERPGKAEWEDFKRAASGASPEPTAEAILKLDEWVAADHMSLSEQHAFRMGFREARHRAAALASGAPTPEPTAEVSMNDIAQCWLEKGYRIVPEMPTVDMLKAMAFCDGYPLDSRERPGLTRWEDYWLAALAALAPQVAPGPGSVDSVDASITPTGAAGGA